VTDLLIRNCELGGRIVDILIEGGRVAAIGPGIRARCETIDARGGAVIPGLADHHIHLLAAAAARASVNLDYARGVDEMIARLSVSGRGWLRVTGYHEHHHGPLDRAELDRIAPGRPVRVQHQTGGLWILNSVAIAQLDLAGAPAGVNVISGHFARVDDWVREQLRDTVPDLKPIAHALAAVGVTSVTDASVTNDQRSMAAIAKARADRILPQSVTMMSGGPLSTDGDIAVGPVKILLDDHDLPPLDELIDRFVSARTWGRRIAVHCVTAAELALALAAFATVGSISGDRIEHGGVIAIDAIPEIARLGLTVVTQSAFPFERGDRYLATVDRRDIGDLYRCGTLKRAGVAVAGSSDAPYGTLDPWCAMRAAIDRRTADGQSIGPEEALAPRAALALYLGSQANPGDAPRRVELGAPADICLLHEPLDIATADLSHELVAATIIAGQIAHHAKA